MHCPRCDPSRFFRAIIVKPLLTGLPSSQNGRYDIVEKSLLEMEEQLNRTTSERAEKSNEGLSLSTLSDSAKNQCSTLREQLEQDRRGREGDAEAIGLWLNAKGMIDAELRAEREKFCAAACNLAKERNDLAINLEESRRKEEAGRALAEDLLKENARQTAKISDGCKVCKLVQCRLDALEATSSAKRVRSKGRARMLEDRARTLEAETKYSSGRTSIDPSKSDSSSNGRTQPSRPWRRARRSIGPARPSVSSWRTRAGSSVSRSFT